MSEIVVEPEVKLIYQMQVDHIHGSIHGSRFCFGWLREISLAR